MSDDDESFETFLDQAWNRLWDKKVELSLIRAQKCEESLERIEADIDRFLTEDFSPQGQTRGA
jgi:hypothetical protein